MSAETHSRVERNTTHTVVQSSREVESKLNPSSSVAPSLPDVAEQSRAEVVNTVKTKFVDIFEVGNNECTSYDDSVLENVKETNVAGRLSLPESVTFFESIGAPPFIMR